MKHSLHSAVGIEVEYVLVDADTLDILPVADQLLELAAGPGASAHEDGHVAWSNELVAHQIELKGVGPVVCAGELSDALPQSLRRMRDFAAELGASLLPTAMHPWMDPKRETRLWPGEGQDIYRAYDAIYDCCRHGWSNVQSTHLNLPFADEEEFGRLMRACRAVLPLLPALAASSPYADGRRTGVLDTRLQHYAANAARTPAMTGDVIPEPIYGEAQYRATVFGGIQRALAELDPDGWIGGHEYANARGAIARFDRGAIEIRLLDVQEFVTADLAFCDAVSKLVRDVCEERWAPLVEVGQLAGHELIAQLGRAIEIGPAAPVEHALARCFGGGETLGEIWLALLTERLDLDPRLERGIDPWLRGGTLAQRMLAKVPEPNSKTDLLALARELVACLADDRPLGS